MTDTAQKVYDVILAQFVIDRERLSDATSLDDLGADSTALVELMVNLEGAFDTPMPDVAEGEIRTIGDIIAFIERHRAARQANA